jgi:hypothetical protein
MIDPIFICGHRKSGTTMFHDLFDGHDQLLVYPSDLNLLYAYFPLYISGEYTNSQRRERLDKIIFKDLKDQLEAQIEGIVLDINKFKEYFFSTLDDADLLKMKAIITKLMEAYSKVTNKINRIPVIKETSIEIYAQEIFEWFPKSKFIHLVRDPRDNYAALKSGVASYYSKMGENEKETLASLIHRIRIGLEIGFVNLNKYRSNKYLFVNFNELVNDIEPRMKEISIFLGINYNKSLLIPTRLEKNVKGNNFDGNKFSAVTSKNNNRWKDRISSDEAKIIEFHLGYLMSKFGFKMSFARNESAKAASEFYKWQNYRYFFNDRF